MLSIFIHARISVTGSESPNPAIFRLGGPLEHELRLWTPWWSPPPPQITRSVDPPGINQRYECPDEVDEVFNADQWLDTLITANSKTSRKQHPMQNSLSEVEIQKLYCTNMMRAIDYIEGHQKILCRVNPDELKSQMTVQLGSKPVTPPPTPVPNTWRQCWRNREALSRPFSEQEVKAALDHASSAPGPDGWTYANLAQLKGFVPAFTSGLHQLAASGDTPDRWRNSSSV